MKFISSISMLLAAAAVSAAPASNYNQLPPSERALIDARNLICGQYPNRDWVLIGSLRVECNSNTVKARDDGDVTVDKNWVTEYAGVN